MTALDSHDILPSGMRKYLSYYGFHFSKKACEYAVEGMKKLDPASGKKKGIDMIPKEQVDEILKRYDMKPDNGKAYDAVYLFHVAKADYPKLCPDEQRQAIFVKETLDDIDASEETTFRVWLAKMTGNGEPIDWEDII